MLGALVAGERDPQVLAELAKGKLRKKLPQLRQALRGRFGEHHGLLVGLALDHLEHLEAAIARLDARVDEVIAPFAAARDRLGDHHRGRQTRRRGHHRRHSAWTCRSLATAGHLASWAGRCPGTTSPGASAAPRKPTKGNHWLADVLPWVRLGRRPQPRHLPGCPVLAAGPPHRQAGRRPWPWATQVLVIAWYLLSNDCDYRDLGGDFFIRRDTDRARQRAVAQLQALGYQVTLQPAA